MEDLDREQADRELFNEVLTLAAIVRRNSYLKFTEKLFRYISRVTEEFYIKPEFNDLKTAFPLFHESTHKAVRLILPMMDSEIKRIFKSVKEYIELKVNLKAYIARFGLFLCSSPYSMLYFFAATARLFALVFKSGQTKMSSTFFIETVVDIFMKNDARVRSFGGLNAMNNLVENILKDRSLISDLPPFKCNELLMFF